MINELNECIWRQPDESSWRRDGEDLVCCYGNLIDAAGSRENRPFVQSWSLEKASVTWQTRSHLTPKEAADPQRLHLPKKRRTNFLNASEDNILDTVYLRGASQKFS
jgi:hypothetical protein